ncbi:hypothetical protein BT96DRAFT_1001569 [Gymnopus androsaceus JB14]|uniref:Uncharacterized protein n=1 Tax=Gymnopus androsaceus JB14 TaxID=1447944 RepID=A0A6A4GZ46_9AGAR|nr:hypothetical protein BT96DRAFT_1001569 [Gymnopus androsaceus JB14]
MVEKYAGDVGCVASELQKLSPGDIRGIEQDALNNEQEMDVRLSRIWCATGVNDKDDEAIHDSLRIVWYKASARAHQWQEECLLIQEEMQWSLATFEKQVVEWENCTTNSLRAQFRDMTLEVIEGQTVSKWASILDKLSMGPGGISLDELEYVLA